MPFKPVVTDLLEDGYDIRTVPELRRDTRKPYIHSQTEENEMQTKRILRIGAIVLVVFACLGGVACGAILWHINQCAERYCAVAQEAHPHPGDDMASLIDYMNCEDHPLRQRNLAIWTLGHLRDPAALPALQSVYTGQECDHSTQLCQYELAKAITLCGGTPDPPGKTGQ